MCKLDDKKTIPGVNACSATPIDNRKLSPKTYAKLREFLGIKEGFRDTAYQDKGGVWTIGYGSILKTLNRVIESPKNKQKNYLKKT